MMRKKGFSGLLILLLVAGVSLVGGTGYFLTTKTSLFRKPSPQEIAGEVINGFKNRDLVMVSKYLCSQKGLQFSPYAYVRSEDVALEKDEFVDAFSNQQDQIWGNYDGSGESINLTFSQYYDHFIYDKDFANAAQISINEIKGQGNTLINISEFYPNSTYVEYYLPGTEEYGGMDWESLILVMQEENDQWCLVGVIHNSWTI